MSGFQRFITYINLYEENSKVRNVGFAKIENRNDQCRMEIHMKGTGFTGISCPVYLFVRDQERMRGIFIGSIQMINGTGDFRGVFEGDNIKESGVRLEQVGGLMIFVNDRIMFASQWDDKEIRRERFVLWEESEKKEDKELKAAQLRSNEKKLQDASREGQTEDLAHTREEERMRKEKAAQGRDISGCNPGTREETTGEAAEGLKKDERSGGKAEQDVGDIEATEAAAQLRMQPYLVQRGPMRQGRSSSQGRPMQQRRAVQPQGRTNQREQPMKQQGRSAKPQGGSVCQEEERQELPWEQKWQFMLEHYPVMTPFEGEDSILCVRMELKDLRQLPKRYWYLGNNSFLLHGFFNYRYLVVGAMDDGEKKRWFIGVPGVFQSQEKVMAAIFGFPEFKSEKIADHKTGQFGYWYRFMDE